MGRNSRRARRQRDRRCPTPDKASWGTLEEAESALRRDYPSSKVPVRAYECDAGHYHLSSRLMWRGSARR